MNETKEIIEKIQGMASESATLAIEQYSIWYFTNAMVWLFLGVTIIISSVPLMKKSLKFWEEDCDGLPAVAVGLMIVIGVVLIAANITNLINPEGYAIHQLLKDLRGGH